MSKISYEFYTEEDAEAVAALMRSNRFWIGKYDEKNDVYGWNFRFGTTGMVSLGDGYYYFSQNWEKDDWFGTTICLYRWDGENPFALVED